MPSVLLLQTGTENESPDPLLQLTGMQNNGPHQICCTDDLDVRTGVRRSKGHQRSAQFTLISYGVRQPCVRIVQLKYLHIVYVANSGFFFLQTLTFVKVKFSYIFFFAHSSRMVAAHI